MTFGLIGVQTGPCPGRFDERRERVRVRRLTHVPLRAEHQHVVEFVSADDTGKKEQSEQPRHADRWRIAACSTAHEGPRRRLGSGLVKIARPLWNFKDWRAAGEQHQSSSQEQTRHASKSICAVTSPQLTRLLQDSRMVSSRGLSASYLRRDVGRNLFPFKAVQPEVIFALSSLSLWSLTTPDSRFARLPRAPGGN
jgi:hypothetical protein